MTSPSRRNYTGNQPSLETQLPKRQHDDPKAVSIKALSTNGREHNPHRVRVGPLYIQSWNYPPYPPSLRSVGGHAISFPIRELGRLLEGVLSVRSKRYECGSAFAALACTDWTFLQYF